MEQSGQAKDSASHHYMQMRTCGIVEVWSWFSSVLFERCYVPQSFGGQQRILWNVSSVLHPDISWFLKAQKDYRKLLVSMGMDAL